MKGLPSNSFGLLITAVALFLTGCNDCSSYPPTHVGGRDSGPVSHADGDSGTIEDGSTGVTETDFGTDREIPDAGSLDASISTGWRFVVTGDSRGTFTAGGHNTEILQEIVAAAITVKAELFLFVGDLVYGTNDAALLQAELEAWCDTIQPLRQAGIAVYPVRGNHDTGNLSAWNTVFSSDSALPANGPFGERNLTFSTIHKNALIIGLDVYVTPRRVNQAWLDDQLATNTAEHIFAFAHVPAFSAGHLGCLDDYPVQRDAFWLSLKQAGGRVYLAGHDHFYAHVRIDDGDGQVENDLHQYIVGTAGAPLVAFDNAYTGDNGNRTPVPVYSRAAFGFLLVEINGNSATLTFMERVAKDSFSAVDTWHYMVNRVHP